jgi:hypothetical protein
LSTVLEKDFDAVPCPACGHYQRYMFPKLPGNTGLWARVGLFVVILSGCLAAVNALLRSVSYLQHRDDYGLGQMVAAWSIVLALGLAGLGLAIADRVLTRRFNPNAGDPQERIALGRSRAVTRAEFEKAQAAARPG